MTHTEAVSPPSNCTVSGLRESERSGHPLEPLWRLGQDTSESPYRGIGVRAVWPRRRLVMPTSRQPANIPTQRCGTVGSPVVVGRSPTACGSFDPAPLPTGRKSLNTRPEACPRDGSLAIRMSSRCLPSQQRIQNVLLLIFIAGRVAS
jgi:hypothetical protein